NQALGASSKRSALYREAAALLAWNGRTPEALRLLDRAAQILPQDREIPLMKATTLELAGESDAAEKAIGQALKLAPDDPRIKSLAARIALEKSGGSAAQRNDSTASDDTPYLKRLFLEKPPQSW